MSVLLRTACLVVVAVLLFPASGCRKTREVFTLAPPDQAAVEAFLPEQTFGTENGDVTIMTSGISELKIADVYATQDNKGSAVVSFVHTSDEGTWRLEGTLVYYQEAGTTVCVAIEFAEATLISAGTAPGADDSTSAPSE